MGSQTNGRVESTAYRFPAKGACCVCFDALQITNHPGQQLNCFPKKYMSILLFSDL